MREFLRLLQYSSSVGARQTDAFVKLHPLLDPYLCHPSQPNSPAFRRLRQPAYICRPRVFTRRFGWCGHLAADRFDGFVGRMKNSSSICSNSRERKVKLRGVTSCETPCPFALMPNGTFCREVSSTFLNCAKMACAVSGRR